MNSPVSRDSDQRDKTVKTSEEAGGEMWAARSHCADPMALCHAVQGHGAHLEDKG